MLLVCLARLLETRTRGRMRRYSAPHLGYSKWEVREEKIRIELHEAVDQNPILRCISGWMRMKVGQFQGRAGCGDVVVRDTDGCRSPQGGKSLCTVWHWWDWGMRKTWKI